MNRKLITSAALAAALLAPATASADSRLSHYGDTVRAKTIATSHCGPSATCIRSHLLSLTTTYTAAFRYASTVVQSAPSESCLNATRPLTGAGTRALHTTTAWYTDIWNAGKIRAWGAAQLALVNQLWRAGDAC